jgi:predicted metalloprotease with PDZ domain
MNRSLAVGFVALAPWLSVGAQRVSRGIADSVSVPVREVTYDVTFRAAQGERRTIDVTMTLTAAGSGPVLLSLPAWTPGAYEISNFARWITRFEATGNGRPLVWDKTDVDTWRILPAAAGAVRVRFQYVAETLDNAMAWAKPDFVFFNGTNVFLYPRGRPLDFPSTVTVHTEPGWHVATGLSAVPGSHSFKATNYHELVDMPFFVGRFDFDSGRVANKWVRFATYPAGTITGPARQKAWDQIKKVIPPEIAVFGEAPWDCYTVMQVVDSSFAGASGLEHQNSHLDVLAPSYVGGEFQPSLYAHEIFHSWNVKRLRPAEMWPYEYAHPQPTTQLWIAEGVTDYYADLAEVRGGVTDASGFYAATSEKIMEVMTAPPTALEDASLSAWVHPVDGTEYLYYPKGSLAGLALDIAIRDASENRQSLDDVMRALYQSAYKQGRGFTSSDWWAAVSAAAGGKSFASFYTQFIEGREPFPWDSILPLAGLRARRDRVPRLGVVTQMDGDAIVVVNVQDGSSAALSGVRVGDVLLSVGDIGVQDQQFGAKLRAKYGASSEGSPLQIKVRRRGETLTLAGKLQFAPGDAVVEPDPATTPKALRIRDGILKGTTGG